MENSLTKLLPGIKDNISLAPYATYKIGGPARYFFVAQNEDDIVRAVRAAKETETPLFILGGGSNLLISDKGFNGLVIKIQNTRYKISLFARSRIARQDTFVQADAGVEMPTLVLETIQRGLGGLEWAGGLPGTLGGAVRGNAGAFRGEIKDTIQEVKALDTHGDLKIFSKDECEFSYRSSVFKKKNLIVLSAKILLIPSDKKTIMEEAESHIQYRKERHPLEYPNAGSVFKNCDLNLFSKIEWGKFEHVIKIDPFPVVPTAYLLSEASMKGVTCGGAMVSEKHPNFIINKNNAKAEDVAALMKIAAREVKEKFGVDLEPEVQLVGFGER